MTNSNLPPRNNIIADLIFIILITILALAVHGFHYGIEDEAIYLPAIKKYLDPSLYPFDSVFFCASKQPHFTSCVGRLTGESNISASALGCIYSSPSLTLPGLSGLLAIKPQ